MPELFDAEAAFHEAFQDELNAYPDDANWLTSGRPSKAHPVGEDEDWWRAQGPGMVQRWIDWRKESPWEIWIAPDGQPGIELELNVLIDKTQEVKMFIDCVFATAPNNQRPMPVDVKSGSRVPDSHTQLGLYKVGLELAYPGVHVSGGCYWMARSGTTTPVITLDEYTPRLFAEWFRQVRVAKQMGVFLPNPSNLCRSCKVGEHCAVNNGKNRQADPDFQLMGGAT